MARMLDTVNDLLANQEIPAIDTVRMLDLLHYLLTPAEKTVRILVAEVTYRYDHDHPSAMDVFLACTLPLAERAARRRAYKFFKRPSDWQIELIYDGAVTAMIAMFQRNSILEPGTNAFRQDISLLIRSPARRLHLNGVSSHQLTRDAEIIPWLKTASYLGVVQLQSTVLRFVSNPGHTT
jgi:hypothetical protein